MKEELSVPFTVICVDAKNMPNEIPRDKWLIEKQKYTVVEFGITLNGKLGFKLQEIKLDQSCYPFDCFNPKRFSIPMQPRVKTLHEELEELGIEVEKTETSKYE